MPDPISPRAALKRACLDRLDAVAGEHLAGHQGKLAARYVLNAIGGDRISLMFEKHDSAGTYLWMEQRLAKTLLDLGITWQPYPALDLYPTGEPGTKPRYGRHAALKAMRDLANADLVRFEIATVGEIELLLKGLAHQASQKRKCVVPMKQSR